jgi:hypothetical protein
VVKVLTKDKTMATIQAEALAYMICETFFDGSDSTGQERLSGRLEASLYLLSDLLKVAVNGGAKG